MLRDYTVFPNTSQGILSAVAMKHFSIFINLNVLSGIATDYYFLFFPCVCVCVLILGRQKTVTIVTHKATCFTLISEPWTALSFSVSFFLSHPNSKRTTMRSVGQVKREGFFKEAFGLLGNSGNSCTLVPHSSAGSNTVAWRS